MKILVAIKRVLDPAIEVRVREDETGVDIKNEKMSMNPFDEIAVEEAIRLKESGVANEIIAVSCGNTECESILRTAMAMGVDRSILVKTDDELQPLAIAKILNFICKKETPSLVICGKQSIDNDLNQTAQMLAGINGWPQALFASRIEFLPDNKEALVTSEIDGGLEILKVSLPAVISADLRLNKPRYVTLMNVMKAKKKLIETIPSESLDIDMAPRLKCINVTPAPQRKSGVVVKNVAELVDKLKNQSKVI